MSIKRNLVIIAKCQHDPFIILTTFIPLGDRKGTQWVTPGSIASLEYTKSNRDHPKNVTYRTITQHDCLGRDLIWKIYRRHIDKEQKTSAGQLERDSTEERLNKKVTGGMWRTTCKVHILLQKTDIIEIELIVVLNVRRKNVFGNLP